MTNTLIGLGCKFEIESDSSPGTYDSLDEIKNLLPPSSEADVVDVSHNKSDRKRREFISALVNPGICSFDMNYVPGSSSDNRLNILFSDAEPRLCRITYPNLVTHLFSGILSKYELEDPQDNEALAKVSFQVTGTIIAVPAPSLPEEIVWGGEDLLWDGEAIIW